MACRPVCCFLGEDGAVTLAHGLLPPLRAAGVGVPGWPWAVQAQVAKAAGAQHASVCNGARVTLGTRAQSIRHTRRRSWTLRLLGTWWT